MRKSALLAITAGAMFAGTAGLPGPADAMTFSGPAGMRSAAAAADVAQPQQVRYCNWRGCWHGAPYWPGSPYGLWQTYPYVGYNVCRADIITAPWFGPMPGAIGPGRDRVTARGERPRVSGPQADLAVRWRALRAGDALVPVTAPE